MVNKITAYIKSSIEEMQKVTWPTRKETWDFTILVIGISLGVALFLGALDYGFTKILNLVIENR